MGGPYDKSDVNQTGKMQTQEQTQRDNGERGGGNGVNQADPGKRRSEPTPLYRHHPPPAQQSSAYIRRQI